MKKPTNTILPWRNESELTTVKEWFYASTLSLAPSTSTSTSSSLSFTINEKTTSVHNSKPDNRQKAINQVQLWTWKFHTTPHAVISTASLTDARLHDESRWTKQIVEPDTNVNADEDEENKIQQIVPTETTTTTTTKPMISENAMKSIYSHTFIRFVNGFVDRDVKKSTNLSCEAFGLSSVSVSSSIPTTTAGIPSTSPASTSVSTTKATNREQHRSTNPTIPTSNQTSNQNQSSIPNPNQNPSSNQNPNPNSSTTSTTTSMSMYTTACKLGMPPEFIDFRHRVTHHGADLPGLAELRRMNDLALRWIYVRWWVHNTVDHTVDNHTVDHDTVDHTVDNSVNMSGGDGVDVDDVHGHDDGGIGVGVGVDVDVDINDGTDVGGL